MEAAGFAQAIQLFLDPQHRLRVFDGLTGNGRGLQARQKLAVDLASDGQPRVFLEGADGAARLRSHEAVVRPGLIAEQIQLLLHGCDGGRRCGHAIVLRD